MKHRRLWKTFHLYALMTAALLAHGKTAAQTPGNELPKEKVRVNETRTLQIKTDTVKASSKTLGSFNSNTLTISYTFLNHVFLKFLNKDNSANTGTIQHEWNHYKNYMFGSELARNTPEDAFLLVFLDELLSRKAGRMKYDGDRQRNAGAKERLRLATIRELNKDINYLMNDHGYMYTFLVLANYDPCATMEHSTDSIIRDMHLMYISGHAMDLRDYLTDEDAAEINKRILSHPSARSFIEIIRSRVVTVENIRQLGLNQTDISRLAEISTGTLDLSSCGTLRIINFNQQIKFPQIVKFPKHIECIDIRNADMSEIKVLDLREYSDLASISIRTDNPPDTIFAPNCARHVHIYGNASGKKVHVHAAKSTDLQTDGNAVKIEKSDEFNEGVRKVLDTQNERGTTNPGATLQPFNKSLEAE
jgi:hypothetical protein